MAMAILTNGSKKAAVGKSFNAIAFAWRYRLWGSGKAGKCGNGGGDPSGTIARLFVSFVRHLRLFAQR